MSRASIAAVVCCLLAVATPPHAATPPTVGEVSRVAVPFVQNAGQWDARAAFGAPLFGGHLFVTRDGMLVYRLDPPAPRRDSSDWILTETLVASGASIPAPRGEERQRGTATYAVGSDVRRHHTDVATFGRVVLGESFPGVDVALRATGRNVEKIFTVAPGAAPDGIRIDVGGATSLAIGPDGSLVAGTGNGPVAYTAPIAFQLAADGSRQPVEVRYVLEAGSHRYGFAVGEYDAKRPLVIDPLMKATYAAANLVDVVTTIAVHPGNGDVYIGGSTASTQFPGTTGGAQAAYGTGTLDGFVARFDPTLTTRLQSTFVGGSGTDELLALAIHPHTGDVFVAGHTSSTDLLGTTGTFQAAHNAMGGSDAFVMRLSSDLKTRIRTSYLGGDGDELVSTMAIHPVSGEIYIGGQTFSANLPANVGGVYPSISTNGDGFVSRMSPDLTELFQSTFLGGTGEDFVLSLVVDKLSNQIVVGGSTNSPSFPGSANGAQPAPAAGLEGFVSRLPADLKSPATAQTTLFGGSGPDVVNAVGVLPSGEVVAVGWSGSPSIAGISGMGSGTQDAILAVYNGALSQITHSARLAANAVGNDTFYAVAIHPATGEIYAAGSTLTPPASMPSIAGAARPTFGGGVEAFIARFSASATLLQTTYYGGTNQDEGAAIAIHPITGDVYLGGYTSSSDLPNTLGSAQPGYGVGGFDGYVARFTFDLRNAAVAQPAAFSFPSIFNAPPGSLQTSAAATISGLGVSPQTIAILGGNMARYCISPDVNCTCGELDYRTAATEIQNGQSVCVRQFAPPTTPGGASATILVGGGSASFFVGTGSGGCTLDVDGNGTKDPLTDGLLIMRALLGFTGTAVTDNALGATPARGDWNAIRAYLNGNCGTNFAP